MALVKPAARSSTAVHRWRECLNGNSAEIPKGIFKMTFLVRAAACQRPSIRNDVAAVDSDAADFDPSGFLTAPLIANQSAIFQNGQRLVGSRNGLYGISVRERNRMRLGASSCRQHFSVCWS